MNTEARLDHLEPLGFSRGLLTNFVLFLSRLGMNAEREPASDWFAFAILSDGRQGDFRPLALRAHRGGFCCPGSLIDRFTGIW